MRTTKKKIEQHKAKGQTLQKLKEVRKISNKCNKVNESRKNCAKKKFYNKEKYEKVSENTSLTN